MWNPWEMKHAGFGWKILNKNRLQDLDIDGGLILKWILKKHDRSVNWVCLAQCLLEWVPRRGVRGSGGP